MTICKRVVNDNMVLLEAGVRLPEGAEVEVRLLDHRSARRELFARVRARRIPRIVGMEGILAEDKREREEHHDTGLTP